MAKFILNGTIYDSELILSISSLDFDRNLYTSINLIKDPSYNDSIRVGPLTFDIRFVNNIFVTAENPIKRFNKNIDYFILRSNTKYHEARNIFLSEYEEMMQLRQRVIDFWNNNAKSPIPNLDL